MEANLQVLEDILNITNNNLDLLSNEVLSDELSEEQASALINEVTDIIDTSTYTIVKLLAKLLEVNNSVSDASTLTMEGLFTAASAFPYTSLTQLSKEITSSKEGTEKTVINYPSMTLL